MNYQSTRNHRLQASSAAAVLEGIAADGGLYIRDDLSTMNFDWKGLLGEDSLTMSARCSPSAMRRSPPATASTIWA